ncbi:autotransporter outer membrane beta-barrel domain-containing protein [Herbaspirillum sp. LeCh32-8]|uniref:autotransporter family protein n=1 Tax=Herbaspirillum sp. LeCh32-8 TaxID=2821356 RepID=UPI001AE4FDF5|nr:autotransporter outer membrane beta-barrel domain-containing protein [Herbaspirillum sp. LeCh32-8]MBP0600665.1 autotransporter outer membrane beta-barrel domain-containing protein [Herbaspirillum sp. LeCh32-8]
MTYAVNLKKKPIAMLLARASAVSLLLASVPSLSRADTVFTSGTWDVGQTATRTPNINGPANALQTSFTGYTSGPYHYVLYTFYVGTSGNYSATATTASVLNTNFLLRGLFSPSNTAPATPLGNFVGAVLASGSGPYSGSFSNIALTAGQQYTFLLAYNIGGAAGELSTLRIIGPGCISLGTVNMCARYVANSNTATGNGYALGAAQVIDANQNLLNYFQQFNGNQQATANATAQTLPLLTGGSTAVVRGTMNSIGNIVQARIGAVTGRASGDSFLGDQYVWIKPFGSHANQGNRDGVAGYKAETYGMVGGVDGMVSPKLRAGGAFAYATSNINGNSTVAPQSNSVDIYQLIGYGSYALDERSAVNFQADAGLNKNKGNRQLPFTSTAAASSYNSLTAHVGSSLERRYALSEASIFTPSVRVDYTWIRDKAYSETGAGVFNLNVNSRTAQSLILGVDGKVSHQLNDQTTLIANLGIGYDALSKQDSITAAYAGAAGAAFTTYGMSTTPWVSRGGFGMVYRLKNGLEITGRYDAEFRESFINQTASANLRWAF